MSVNNNDENFNGKVSNPSADYLSSLNSFFFCIRLNLDGEGHRQHIRQFMRNPSLMMMMYSLEVRKPPLGSFIIEVMPY